MLEDALSEVGFCDAIELLDWDCVGDDAAVVEPLEAHLATLSPGKYDALATHLRALDRHDVADRVFGPFRDRFFPDEFSGLAVRVRRGRKGLLRGRPRGAFCPAR